MYFVFVCFHLQLITGKNKEVDSLHAPCHKIYRVEAVSLSIPNYT